MSDCAPSKQSRRPDRAASPWRPSPEGQPDPDALAAVLLDKAKRRLASHIALDWRCATNPDPFAADVHSVRPNSRRAFFKRWGCLCRVNAGNYTLEECADPDR